MWTIETYVLTIILIISFGFALQRLKKEDGNPFAIKLMKFLLWSNICYFMCRLSFYLSDKAANKNAGDSSFAWWIGGILAFICFIAQQILFDLATWLLAFNCFICA